MAGLIAALFGGRSRPPDTEPAPGIGGVAMPRGPAGQSGFPGSTSTTRTFPGRNPRGIRGNNTTIKADSNTGWDSALGTTPQVRQASYRAELATKRGGTGNQPRQTPTVVVPQTVIAQQMQHNSAAEFFGGPMLHTGPGNNTAGGEPGRASAAAGGHNARDTTTLWSHARTTLAVNTPGSQNVRNQFAQRYKNVPGQTHTYNSAPRADQAGVLPTGQAADGNVHPDRATSAVSVPNRFVYAGGGFESWAVERKMPYTGPGDGARGSHLDGRRYYAQGQTDQFFNAGQGDYGIERARGAGNKRPVSFTEPAPWTAQFYDTTDSVESQSNAQAPSMVYVSPSAGRAGNSTGRTG